MQAKAVRISSLGNPADSFTLATDAFYIYCESKNLSENTIAYYRYRLEAFRRFLDGCSESSAPKDITRQIIRQFIKHEIDINCPSTANHGIITLRAFFGFLVDEGFLDSSPVNGITKVRVRKRIIQTFTPDQIERILAACGKDFTGVRDKAIITLLFDCGLRASELCSLTMDKIDMSAQTIKVIGKGDKERLVSFGSATRKELARYTCRRPDLPISAVFVTWFGDSLSRFRLNDIIKRRCKTAEITGVRCSPHTFRHTFAVSYLRAGGDVFTLQKILGHNDLTMTRRYCEVSQTDTLVRHRAFSPADRLKPTKPDIGRRKRIA